MSGGPALAKAVLLARGIGTRMARGGDASASLTREQREAAAEGRKALMPVAGRPLVIHQLEALVRAGYREACCVVAPDERGRVPRDWREIEVPGLALSFALQLEPLGTADAVQAAEEFAAGDDLAVLNGDTLYPDGALGALREPGGPRTVLFTRRGLVQKGNVPRERAAAFALGTVDADGFLVSLVEKPDPALVEAEGDGALLSMNCWRFGHEIFEAARSIQPSPRGELELPDAVMWTMRERGVRYRVIRSDEGVLDLSTRADIETVERKLRSSGVARTSVRASASDILAIAAHFVTPGIPREAQSHGSGHIHQTHLVECGKGRVILQRINTEVFRDPDALMENVVRVTEHIAAKTAGLPDARRRSLRLIPLREGGFLYRDRRGGCWRAMHFVPNAISLDAPRSPADACEAARAFARFNAMLADLPAPRLHETIPHFHDTPARFAAFAKAVADDPRNRATEAREIIDALVKRESLAGVLLAELAAGHLEERVTHNDAKVDNVLLDERTGEGLCVIDLDTVMPGLFLYDFGDMVRSIASSAAEDEREAAKVAVSLPMFEALVRGTLAESRRSEWERALLVTAGAVVTFEQTLRFLTDHLLGDPYYRISYPGHNLVRARAQLALLESVERHRDEMERIAKMFGS